MARGEHRHECGGADARTAGGAHGPRRGGRRRSRLGRRRALGGVGGAPAAGAEGGGQGAKRSPIPSQGHAFAEGVVAGVVASAAHGHYLASDEWRGHLRRGLLDGRWHRNGRVQHPVQRLRRQQGRSSYFGCCRTSGSPSHIKSGIKSIAGHFSYFGCCSTSDSPSRNNSDINCIAGSNEEPTAYTSHVSV